MLELPGGVRWVIEIKRSSSPALTRGFHSVREDLRPTRSFVVYAGSERFTVIDGVEAISLQEMVNLVLTETT